MKRLFTSLLLILFGSSAIWASYGYFSDCPAFATVEGQFYEVGACSGTSSPLFDGTSLSNVNSLHLTYAEVQTFENSGDNVMNGMLWYRVYTGSPSGSFTQVDLNTLALLGGGNERRSENMNIDLLAGLMPSTAYVLEIYFQGDIDWNPVDGTKNTEIYHSNSGSNYKLSFTTGSLPVELSLFRLSSVNDDKPSLHWRTASELDNSHFEVERSADSRRWYAIGEVTGNGTAITENNYYFTDKSPLFGINYYRLKQVDFNGNYEYSKVVSAFIGRGNASSVALYPNPATDLVSFQLPDADVSYRATLFDQMGKRWLDSPLDKNSLDITHLPMGTYMLVLKNESGERLFQERLVKQ